MKHVRKRLTYANVMSSIAMFLVIGGGAAFAAIKLPKNSVGTRELKPKSVNTGILARNVVRTGKLAPEAAKAGKIAKNAIPTNRLRDGAVATEKIANEAVSTEKIGGTAVTNEKIAPAAVETGKLADAAVTKPKLADAAVGAAEFGAITIRTNTVTVGTESLGTVVQSCQGDERMLSGGGGFDIVTAAPHPQVIMSMAQNDNTWRVRAFNPSAAFERTLTVRIFCLDV